MIEVKRVEIRDAATTVPALAVRVIGGPSDPVLHRAGFGAGVPMVILIHLTSMLCHYDPYHWVGNRTMHYSHLWLQENWDRHQDAGVVDVEFLLGDRTEPKSPEIGV